MIRYQKKAAGLDFWTALSFVVQVVYNGAVYYYWGYVVYISNYLNATELQDDATSLFEICVNNFIFSMPAIVYLLISTTFAVGLHPLGARWIAEHYASQPKQVTL